MFPSVPKRHRISKTTLTAIVAAFVVLWIDNLTYPLYVKPNGPSKNLGANSLWLSTDWAMGRRKDTSALAARLMSEQVQFAYVHVPGVLASGTLRPRSEAACRMLAADLHRRIPGVKVIAWIFAGNSRMHGRVNLADPIVRARMAQEAGRLVRDEGFDGVQWDYEICADGDPGFLLLLDETRMALPRGALLCVASPLWLPNPFHRWGWSEAYFMQVARRVDQIAVMGYDTMLTSPRAYVWLVSQQAVHVTRAVRAARSRCQVVIGVPTYKDGTLSHDPYTETLALAIIGVRNGLHDARAAPSVFAGIAPFADYTTSAGDWKNYHRIWIGPDKESAPPLPN